MSEPAFPQAARRRRRRKAAQVAGRVPLPGCRLPCLSPRPWFVPRRGDGMFRSDLQCAPPLSRRPPLSGCKCNLLTVTESLKQPLGRGLCFHCVTANISWTERAPRSQCFRSSRTEASGGRAGLSRQRGEG